MIIIIGADLHDQGANPVMRGTSLIVALKKEFLLKFDKGCQSWIGWLFEAWKWLSVLAAWLLGIRESGQLTFHAQREALFENLVVAGGVQRAGKAEEIAAGWLEADDKHLENAIRKGFYRR